MAIEGLAGVTETDTRTAAVTVSEVEPEMAPEVALMVVVPEMRLVARPRDPAALEIAATEVSEDAHVTVEVRSCVVLSL